MQKINKNLYLAQKNNSFPLSRLDIKGNRKCINLSPQLSVVVSDIISGNQIQSMGYFPTYLGSSSRIKNCYKNSALSADFITIFKFIIINSWFYLELKPKKSTYIDIQVESLSCGATCICWFVFLMFGSLIRLRFRHHLLFQLHYI